MTFGLIGEQLGHSFSKMIHTAFALYPYQLWELAPEELEDFLTQKNFDGINVTIPYKEAVISYCDVVDEKAMEIGAVNTIVNREGVLYGYNTDYFGFLYLTKQSGVSLEGKNILVLGDGGTAKTVRAVAKAEKAGKITTVSRNPAPTLADRISYATAAKAKDTQIIINTSPVGMYPNNGDCLVDIADYPALEAVFDAVYNPLTTELLFQARARDIVAENGLSMLVAQAWEAASLFTGRFLEQSLVSSVTEELLSQRQNISLIGMPGAGKTSLGQELSKALGKTFVDLDLEIEKTAGKKITELFKEEGEGHFRQLEKEITARVSKETAQVISTGGGIILDPSNIKNLKQNGIILWIDAPVEELSLGAHRPLAQQRQDLEKLYRERQHLYRKAADIRLEYHPDFSENVKQMLALFS